MAKRKQTQTFRLAVEKTDGMANYRITRVPTLPRHRLNQGSNPVGIHCAQSNSTPLLPR